MHKRIHFDILSWLPHSRTNFYYSPILIFRIYRNDMDYIMALNHLGYGVTYLPVTKLGR